jgi:uncharacterized metal-binding protein YceD (DUF177 family)
MKVHIQQLPPEGIHIEGEEPNTLLDLHDPHIVPLTPISYALDVGLSEGGLFATGQLGIDLEMVCVGCLERFTMPIRVEDFACQVELTKREEIDLTEAIREDILLALPHHPHCDWNGRKECPGVQPPSATEVESGESRPDVWGALDQLKLK